MAQKKQSLDPKLVFALVLTGISWLLLSVFIFIYLGESFEFLKLMTYLLWSFIIGAYAYFLILKKPLYSSVFFTIGYVLSFYALYYNARHSVDKVSTYFVIFISLAVLLSFSAVGYLLDHNTNQRKKLKELEMKNKKAAKQNPKQ